MNASLNGCVQVKALIERQAANFNMEATAPARQQARMFRQAAATACQFQAPVPRGPAEDPDAPSLLCCCQRRRSAKMTEVLAVIPTCRQWSATEIICQATPPKVGFGPCSVPSRTPLRSKGAQPTHTRCRDHLKSVNASGLQPPLPLYRSRTSPKGLATGETRAINSEKSRIQPTLPVLLPNSENRAGRRCAEVIIPGQRPQLIQLITVFLASGEVVPKGGRKLEGNYITRLLLLG